jgi:hypothetical protein
MVIGKYWLFAANEKSSDGKYAPAAAKLNDKPTGAH